jgi:hypothetical protein
MYGDGGKEGYKKIYAAKTKRLQGMPAAGSVLYRVKAVSKNKEGPLSRSVGAQ